MHMMSNKKNVTFFHIYSFENLTFILEHPVCTKIHILYVISDLERRKDTYIHTYTLIISTLRTKGNLSHFPLF